MREYKINKCSIKSTKDQEYFRNMAGILFPVCIYRIQGIILGIKLRKGGLLNASLRVFSVC
jgi:hypothetical protein